MGASLKEGDANSQDVQRVIRCAEMYDKDFAGRAVLFVLTDKGKNVTTLEVKFDGSNFQHLTGMSSSKYKSKKDFFHACQKGSIRAGDICIKEFTRQKLQGLLIVLQSPDLHASLEGDYNQSGRNLEADVMLGNHQWTMGFKRINNNSYVPKTMLKEDIRKLTNQTLSVAAVYRKRQCEREYREIVWKNKKVDFTKLKFPADWKERNLPPLI